MTTIVEQQNTINELLNSGRPVTLETIAQALSVTAQEAAHLLPEGSATFAPGSDFESVWAAIAEWEKITFIVTAHGNVIEVETKLVTGKAAMGYYNLMGGKSPLQGHFKYGDISEIGFKVALKRALASHQIVVARFKATLNTATFPRSAL